MSSEIFEAREEEFTSLSDNLRKKLNEQIPRLLGEERKRSIREVERGIEDATLIIQELEEEVMRAPTPYRIQMVARLRSYKSDIENVTRQLNQVSKGAYSQQNFGFSRDDDFESVAESQRTRLLAGSDILSRTSESIGRSQRVAAETDQIGHEIIDELGSQREQLVRTRDRLVETDAELSRSRKILKGMARRVMTNKMILAFIIIIELIILGGVIYWKFFS